MSELQPVKVEEFLLRAGGSNTMGLFIYQIEILPRMQLFVAHGKIYSSKTSSRGAVHCTAVNCIKAQCSAVLCSAAQHSAVQGSAAVQ